jgi:ParB family chromosome partitioning protein
VADNRATRAKAPSSVTPPHHTLSLTYELHRISLDQIEVPRTRIRRDLGAIGDLAYSLATVGLLQPIQVVKLRARYRLIAGERRLQAARLLGWTEIDALVRQATSDDLLLELAENAQRKFLTDAEEADAFIRLVHDEGRRAADVAAQAGRSEAYVSKRIRVFEDPTLRSAIERGDLAVSLAEEFLTLPSTQRADLVRQAIAERWDVLQVRQAIREPRAQSEAVSPAPLTTPALSSAPRTDQPSVVDGSFRVIDAELEGGVAAQPEQRLTKATKTAPLRGRELVRALMSVREVIRTLHRQKLTAAEERALGELFEALVRLARARQHDSAGPLFPSIEQAERLARRSN